MASNKVKGAIVVGSAIAGFMLLNNQGDKQKTIGGGSGGGFFTATKPAVGNTTTTTIYSVNEGSPTYTEGSNYAGAVATAPTKKANPSSPSYNIASTGGVGNVSEFNSLPEGDTKKALASQYPTYSTPDGGTIQGTYPSGAGGTAIITPPKYVPKKETKAPTRKWYNPIRWFS